MAAALSLALPSDGEEHKAYAPLSSVPVAKLVADRDPLDDAQSVITAFIDGWSGNPSSNEPLERVSTKLPIAKCEVKSFSEVNVAFQPGYTQYHLRCEAGGKVHLCAHRFSDWVKLHRRVAHTLGLPARFPVPKTLGPMLTEGAKAMRAERLGEYIASVIEAAGDAPPIVLCDFLGIVDANTLAIESQPALLKPEPVAPTEPATHAFAACLRCMCKTPSANGTQR